jgi:hypothetical protein
MDVKKLQIWLIVFVVIAVYFYGLDHFIMSIQGLPLNFNMTPAQ